VCVDRLPANWKGDSVTADNEQGAYDATRCLIRLGHKKLATITGPFHLTNAKDRLNGFKRAMRESKLPLRPGYVQETTFDKRGGHSKTLTLLKPMPRPTAVCADNDMIALGSLLAIREAGRRCPEDIFLIWVSTISIQAKAGQSRAFIRLPVGLSAWRHRRSYLARPDSWRPGPRKACGSRNVSKSVALDGASPKAIDVGEIDGGEEDAHLSRWRVRPEKLRYRRRQTSRQDRL
jgi:hypothetical protein